MVTDYWRSTYVPLTPVITATSARGHDSAVFTLATSETATKLDSPIAYYLIQNINTGQISKIIPNRLDQLTISNLNALTSYTFTIAAVSVDGTSPSSPITSVIKTGAVPVVTVVTTTPLAAPAFTLSASSEIRTVNTTATGFTSTSTGGAIASYAINATPPGMNFNTTTGALTGTPNTVAGATTYTVTATNTSGSAIRTFTLTVNPVVYTVGQTGPGGGFIYYVNDTGFNCGAHYTETGSATGGLCHYLEVAPSGWNTGADPLKTWAVDAQNLNNVASIPDEYPADSSSGIGLGYKNSIAIVNQGNDVTTAAGAARAYAGGSKNDWYLPSTSELNLLCQWARGVSPSVTTFCTGGTLNSVVYGADSAGFASTGPYWSSSEATSDFAWDQRFSPWVPEYKAKSLTRLVRPVRAF